MARLDGSTLAHGIGGAQDLPISPELAIAGAVAALTVSFTVLAVAWRTPRYDDGETGRPAPGWIDTLVAHPAFRVGLRVLGMMLFLYTAMAAVFGQDRVTNPFFGIFYVWWWVGLVPFSLLLGPVWKAISPVRTINLAFAKVSGGDPDEGIFRYPERLGYWPAAVGLFAFVWMELVYPYSTELGPVRLWCAVYVAAMLLGGALFGNTFYERADPFEVYSSLVAKMSVWGTRDGRVVVRSPLANLSTVVARPGLVAVTAVLFGSTAFDSFRDSTTWLNFLQEHDIITTNGAVGPDTAAAIANNLALLTFCAGIGIIFALATMATGVDPEIDRRSLPNRFAHSIVPIIVGYIVAHYLTYFVEVGQLTLILASDPFGDGSNYLGTGDLQVNYWLSYHPTLLANTKVAAVVVGHVLGVIAAHDRAIKVLPARHQLTGQLPLLFAMVGFTAGGLFLLFAA
ncbi:hypothetical protein [Nocardioides lianchengensis]|uniref:Fenitrothion hydrolase n=1 Tax=Nocardioides lianchengensis TaxID=1045774 RepID=A0A1G6UUM0_9ACTN|nr:hypothetical protein [Nocardioides lianchengensis]NYG11041.1 hypothetical protein [Nocardioides lianchengensis]SDD44981.1 hypothetical protein SAMN05421872_10894 [Nocardioides lianchengensis]